MNIKTKIITVIIASVLVLPAIFNPQRDGGEVLGVSESVETPSVVPVDDGAGGAETPEVVVAPEPVRVEEPVVRERFKISNPFAGWFSSSDEPEPQITPSIEEEGVRIRDISSGIRDVEGIESQPNSQLGTSRVGNVVWEESPTISVVSDVFTVGSGVEVITPNGSMNLVVNKSRVLVPGTLLVVDQQTFAQLGGNPATEQTLEVEVRAN